MRDFKMTLPKDVLFIIERLNSSGFTAHVVGGSVRDSLIGRSLGDFDITTSALPSETKQVFSEYKTVDTGIKHGTVTLVLSGVPYEITTYRIDGDYKDNRHPDEVRFTDRIEEDLARRDFTVNAMAYDPTGGLVDPFFGSLDIERRIIRAVGDPYVRFGEDALRILRALRFASVLDFRIDERTSEAARDLAIRLDSISKERIYTELRKLISGENAYAVLCEYAEILGICMSGFVPSELPDKERFMRADYLTRISSIFYLNSSDPIGECDRVLSDLKTDKFTRTHTISVLNAYKSESFNGARDVLSALSRYGEDVMRGALDLGILLGRYTDSEASIFDEALTSGIPYRISGLAVRGGDLTAKGIRGEKVGEVLSVLLSLVIDGKIENERSALLDYVTTLI